MSTFRNPVGPQPSKTYWRRRLVVGLGIVAVIVIIILIVVKPGSGTPAAVNTPSSTNTPVSASGKAAACDPANVSIVAVTDAATYAATADPQLSLTETNTGSTPCTFKDGSNVQVYTITSGTETIWTSTDCQKSPVAHTSTLQPNKSVASTPFAWDRTRSSTTTCASTTLPKVVAGGASYHLSVTVNGVTSAKTKQFVLQ